MDPRIEALQAEIKELASEVLDKTDMPLDRVADIEAEISVKSAALDKIEADNRAKAIEAQLAAMDDRFKAFARTDARTKASAILAGTVHGGDASVKAVGPYNEVNFLSALVNRRKGDTDAQEFVKAVLGTSAATGGAIVPGNFVSTLVSQLSLVNPYRELFNVVDGVQGAGVNIPYEITGITAALLQGAYGSNKDVRDFCVRVRPRPRCTRSRRSRTSATSCSGSRMVPPRMRPAAASPGRSVWPKPSTSTTAPAPASRSGSSRRSWPTATWPPSRRPSARSRVRLRSVVASRRWKLAACPRTTSPS